MAVSVDGLAPGIYHYQPIAHALETVKLGSLCSELAEVLVTAPGPAFSAPALIVLAAHWKRTLSKYQERGYRILLLDAGHLAQNILLMAAALDLGACPLAGFLDDRLGELLQLEPVAEPVLYAIMIGQPAE